MSRRTVENTDISQFIELFDGDAVQAVRAIREYVGVQRRASVVPKMASTAPVVIRIADATKSYKVGRQKVRALAGVSLDICEGEFVALTGASGSGKSTLLQLMGGLDKPTSGIVEVDGTNLSKLRDGKLSKFRGQTIGFVFQFFYLQPFLRVATNLEVPAMFARTKRPIRRAKAGELAQAVGIDDRLRHLPRELSGGQMQRVAVARALMNQPKILLADEPTGNLDSQNGAAIIELFEEIRKQFGTTIVVVTHDPAIAARADREIRLKDGVIV
jgi:ABC-type lipoprotein export system ATPase subunit